MSAAATKRFDEVSLRADIAATWGEHGAHIDVFDFLHRLAVNPPQFAPISADWWWCKTHDDDLGPFYCCTRAALADCDPVAVYRKDES